MRPKFSIVIPTRNRSHYVVYALQSALSQTFEDYEIVVSDNDSSDDTPRVVSEFKDERIRYFKTPTTLAMPDSWEFAFDKARGEWKTLLADDNAISSHLLEEVNKALERFDTQVISWSHLSMYFHSSWPDKEIRNTLRFHPFSGSAAKISSQEVVSNMFSLSGDHRAPLNFNSFCRRDLMDTIKQRTHRFFRPPCPDVSSCAVVLGMIESLVYIDLPLGLNGLAKESIGMSQATRRDKPALDFINDYQGEPLFVHAPLKSHIIANYCVESYLRAKDAVPEELKSMEIPWGLYFSQCYENICFLGQKGVDVSAEKKEFFSVFRKQPLGLKAQFLWNTIKMRSGLHTLKPKVRNLLRNLINNSPLLTKIESSLRQRPRYGGIISGDEGGFSNIFEAMQYLDRHVYSSRDSADSAEPAEHSSSQRGREIPTASYRS